VLKSYEVWDHQGVLLEEVSSALPQPPKKAHSRSLVHTHTHTHTHRMDI
jgi:hypothetical protein